MAVNADDPFMLGDLPRLIIRLHDVAGPAELGTGRKFKEKKQGDDEKNEEPKRGQKNFSFHGLILFHRTDLEVKRSG